MRRLEEAGVTLAIRIGVNTGEVFVSSANVETAALGDAVERGGQARADR